MSNRRRDHGDLLERADRAYTASSDETTCGYLLGDTSDSSQCGGRVDLCGTYPELCMLLRITLMHRPTERRF